MGSKWRDQERASLLRGCLLVQNLVHALVVGYSAFYEHTFRFSDCLRARRSNRLLSAPVHKRNVAPRHFA